MPKKLLKNEKEKSNILLYIKISVLALIILGLILVVRAVGIENLVDPDKLRLFIDQFGIFAPIVYGCIYFLATLALLSAAALSILSGIFFGNFWGSVLVIIAATAAAMVAFYLTKFFGKELSEKLSGGSGTLGKMVNKIETEIEQGGFRAFFIMRCLFLPYIPFSYAAGLVKTAKAKDFFWGTFLANCIFSPIFVYLGDSITLGYKALILPLILIVLMLFVPKIVKKIRKSKD